MDSGAEQQHADLQALAHQEWAHHDASAALAQVHLPMAQPLEQAGGAMPNLMPAITALIMQITAHLSGSGNPQMALFFQPLVNMALNMQLQAWQQASATSHSLPMGVMEQMHLAMTPQQAAGAITIDADPVGAAPAPEVVSVSAPAEALQSAVVPAAAAPAADQAQQAQPQPVQAEAQPAAPEAAAAAVAAAAAAGQQDAAAAAAGGQRGAAGSMDAAAGIQPAYRETYESEGSEGEEAEADDDDDYTAKGNRGVRRGSARSSAHRPQRARKRNKLLSEYLTDDEEAEEGGRQHKRRAHLE